MIYNSQSAVPRAFNCVRLLQSEHFKDFWGVTSTKGTRRGWKEGEFLQTFYKDASGLRVV